MNPLPPAAVVVIMDLTRFYLSSLLGISWSSFKPRGRSGQAMSGGVKATVTKPDASKVKKEDAKKVDAKKVDAKKQDGKKK